MDLRKGSRHAPEKASWPQRTLEVIWVAWVFGLLRTAEHPVSWPRRTRCLGPTSALGLRIRTATNLKRPPPRKSSDGRGSRAPAPVLRHTAASLALAAAGRIPPEQASPDSSDLPRRIYLEFRRMERA